MIPLRVALSALAAILLVGLGEISGRAAEPFTIDVILPETGPVAFLGKEEAQALQALETVTNRAGGIDGRTIHFAIGDSESSPQVAVQLLRADMAHNPAVILGPSLTATCNALAPLVAQTGPLVYCFSPGFRAAAGAYDFATSPSTSSLFTVIERYFHDRGWNKVATLVSLDASGQDAQNSIEAAFGAPGSGETIVDREQFNDSDLSIDAQLARIKGSGAQALVAWTTGAPFGTVLRGAREVGLTMPMIASAANMTYAQMSAYKSFMYSPLYFNAYLFIDPSQLSDPVTKRAVAAYRDAFAASGVRPDVGQWLAWDPAAIVLDAFRHLGLDASAKQLHDYIAGIGTTNAFVGIYGRYDFAKYPDRGVGTENVIVGRWDPAQDTWVAASRPGGVPLPATAAK